MPTITALNQALSLMPTTKSTVSAVTMKTAGRLNTSGTPSTRGAASRISGRGQGGPQIGGQPAGELQAEAAEELAEIARPGDGHRDVAHGVLQHQVPADDPGHDLAQRGVGIGVGAAGDGDQRGELGVAQGREAAGDAVSTKETIRAGPAPGRVASPAAAVPTRAKIPAPTIPPIPSRTRSTGPSTRFSGRSPGGSSESIRLIRKRRRSGIMARSLPFITVGWNLTVPIMPCTRYPLKARFLDEPCWNGAQARAFDALAGKSHLAVESLGDGPQRARPAGFVLYDPARGAHISKAKVSAGHFAAAVRT